MRISELNIMKILLVNDHANFGGGGDAVLYLERENLQKRGHEIYTYSWDNSLFNSSDKKYIYAPEPKTKINQKIAKFFGNCAMRKHFREALYTIQPDVIHIHLVSKYPLVIYPEIKGYPVLQTLHGPNLFCISSWGNFKKNCNYCPLGISWRCYYEGCCNLSLSILGIYLYKKLFPLLKNNISLFHSPSIHLKDTVNKLGFTNIKYIPLGIDYCFINQTTLKWPREKWILFIGTLAEQKGVDILLDAFIEVCKQIPDVKLHIAGRGKLENVLYSKVESVHIEDRVIFHGFVDRNMVMQLYRESWIVVMPSVWWEQFGMVIPESLACGTPVIGTEVGGIKEQLFGKNIGILVPPRDAKLLAEKIIYLLKQPKIAEIMGIQGRKEVFSQHHPDKYISSLESTLFELYNNYHEKNI